MKERVGNSTHSQKRFDPYGRSQFFNEEKSHAFFFKSSDICSRRSEVVGKQAGAPEATALKKKSQNKTY